MRYLIGATGVAISIAALGACSSGTSTTGPTVTATVTQDGTASSQASTGGGASSGSKDCGLPKAVSKTVLAGRDLSGCDLSSRTFTEVTMDGSNFSGANFANSSFTKVTARREQLLAGELHEGDFRAVHVLWIRFLGGEICQGRQPPNPSSMAASSPARHDGIHCPRGASLLDRTDACGSGFLGLRGLGGTILGYLAESGQRDRTADRDDEPTIATGVNPPGSGPQKANPMGKG